MLQTSLKSKGYWDLIRVFRASIRKRNDILLVELRSKEGQRGCTASLNTARVHRVLLQRNQHEWSILLANSNGGGTLGMHWVRFSPWGSRSCSVQEPITTWMVDACGVWINESTRSHKKLSSQRSAIARCMALHVQYCKLGNSSKIGGRIVLIGFRIQCLQLIIPWSQGTHIPYFSVI